MASAATSSTISCFEVAMKSRAGFAVFICGGLVVTASLTIGPADAQSGAMTPQKKALMGAVKPIGPYSPGVAAGNMVFLAGQIGLDPASGALVTGGIKAETKQAMENLGKVLQEAGLGYQNVVKTTIFLADIKEFADMNEVYGSFFPEGSPPPARSTVQVAAIPRGARVEIDFIAVR